MENNIINKDNITHIVKNLNPNKSHGWDNWSIKMINICGLSISYPLKLIFIDSSGSKIFRILDKTNIVPVHKKESKVLINTKERLFFDQFGKKLEKPLSD